MHDKLQAARDTLNLTDDQKAKVKDILADAKTKRQAVVSDTSLNEEQKRAKMKELHEGMMSKLNEVLTPEQQAELKKKRTPAKEKPPEQPGPKRPPGCELRSSSHDRLTRSMSHTTGPRGAASDTLLWFRNASRIL